MTDKQIINGVDVGWCKNYNEANSKDCETLYICAENPNCYYKKWQRKEQECEELENIINEAKNSKLDLKSFLVGEAVQNEYEEQLDQLKAENKTQKETIDGFLTILDKLGKSNIKLRETLTEIKEIAEICKCHNADGCYECKYFDDCEVEDEEIPTRDVCKLILQKISEVEDAS